MKETEQLLRTLPVEEQEKWRETLRELDKTVEKNNRRHRQRRDGMDATIADRDPDEGEVYPVAKMLKLSNHEDWIDIIYSRRYQDLHHLVSDPKISSAIESLTDKQKEVLFLHIVHEHTPQEIATITNTTDRNIRKHKDKALKAIRKAIGIMQDNKAEGYIDATVTILGWLTLPTFMVGWEISKRIYPRLKQAVTGRAA